MGRPIPPSHLSNLRFGRAKSRAIRAVVWGRLDGTSLCPKELPQRSFQVCCEIEWQACSTLKTKEPISAQRLGWVWMGCLTLSPCGCSSRLRWFTRIGPIPLKTRGYAFLFGGAPVTLRQESRRRAVECFPFLSLIPEAWCVGHAGHSKNVGLGGIGRRLDWLAVGFVRNFG